MSKLYSFRWFKRVLYDRDRVNLVWKLHGADTAVSDFLSGKIGIDAAIGRIVFGLEDSFLNDFGIVACYTRPDGTVGSAYLNGSWKEYFQNGRHKELYDFLCQKQSLWLERDPRKYNVASLAASYVFFTDIEPILERDLVILKSIRQGKP
jgi:hypothetical protein